MRFKATFLICLILSTLGFSQSGLFKSIGGGANSQANGFAYDSIANKLYLYGQFTRVNQNFPAKYRAIWNGSQWDSIHHLLDDSTWAFQKIQNNIFCFGSKLLKLNSGANTWSVVTRTTKNSTISFLSTFQNNLIIVGPYDSINGQPIKRIAKFDGVSFSGFDNTPFFSQITSAVEFQGKLYIAGYLLVNAPCTTLYRLAVWDGTCWQSVGNGIQGGMSGVGKLVVYKNNLYVSGSFFKTDGNPGNCLFRYDGTTFDDLGGGFLAPSEYISDMFVYKNKLIITGANNSYIPGTSTQSPNFFSFDGSQFCTYFNYQSTNNYFGRIGTFNDTLIFAVPSKTVGVDTVNYIAKYIGSLDNPLLCSNVVGVEQHENLNFNVIISPNPLINKLHLQFDDYEMKTIIIVNILGQIVEQAEGSLFDKEFDLSSLNSGVYFLSIRCNNRKRDFKVIKQ